VGGLVGRGRHNAPDMIFGKGRCRLDKRKPICLAEASTREGTMAPLKSMGRREMASAVAD
jgi:hypothetical protein